MKTEEGHLRSKEGFEKHGMWKGKREKGVKRKEGNYEERNREGGREAERQRGRKAKRKEGLEEGRQRGRKAKRKEGNEEEGMEKGEGRGN